ncbi:mCG1051095 [Mus musculus]|nr:mCG1051095 [Mus musculus]
MGTKDFSSSCRSFLLLLLCLPHAAMPPHQDDLLCFWK